MKLAPGRTTYSHVDAWDPVTGKRAWSMPYKYVLLASMLATAGDLVFTGNPEGEFFALDAKSGEKLWSYQTGAGHARRGGVVCGEWTAIHRYFDRLAYLGGRRCGSGFVSGSGLAAGLDAGGIRAAGGIAMKFLWIGTCDRRNRGGVPGAGSGGRGEQVFAKSCATGYCHGVKGQSSGAPRLAGRGFNRPTSRT